MRKLCLVLPLICIVFLTSCYTTRTAGNSGKVPPGQAKKAAGTKSAKPFAHGQRNN